MRFASLGGSNAGNYAAAGKSVADSGAKMHAVQRKAGPDYGMLSQVAMKTASNEKIAGMQAEARLTNVAQKVYSPHVKEQFFDCFWSDAAIIFRNYQNFSIRGFFFLKVVFNSYKSQK